MKTIVRLITLAELLTVSFMAKAQLNVTYVKKPETVITKYL